MTDFIKQLKEHINIAEVVGEYVRLRKTGSNHMGLCPFHGERSPSFSVSERKGIYHCFGCQRGGDAISFIQEVQGISFHEAVRSLASKVGVKVPPEFASRGGGGAARPGLSEDKLEIYYKLNRFVAQFYHERLLSPDGEGARQYLRDRGVNEQMIKTAYMGYAPVGWAELYDFLDSKKAPLDKAEELGLIRRKNTDSSGREHYDLFRDRVMFPVVDLRGRVIAFGARALGQNDGPKYLNSTESPIYKKGSHLFGLFYAQKEIRAEDLCVVVEGFMDCLSLQQAGIGYTVATLGTALTQKQVQTLKRFSKNIVMLFDGDAAGKEAQIRAMETFLDEDVVVRGITLPDEYDPDEFVRARGVETLSAMVKSAPFALDQRILELASQSGAHMEARSRAVDEILPWIAKISSDTARLVRIQELANLFGVGFEVLERRISQLRSAPPQGRPTGGANQMASRSQTFVGSVTNLLRPKTGATTGSGVDGLDAKLIETLIRFPHLIGEISDKNGILTGLETEATKKIVKQLLEANTGALNSAMTEISADIVESTDAPALKTILNRALIVAEQEKDKQRTPEEQELLVQEIKDLEKRLIRKDLERRKDGLRTVIMKADSAGDVETMSKLMNEYRELVKKLDDLAALPR